MVFSVVMYGCESWTIKKAEHQKIDGFELWCWRRLLRVPWTARRLNQSVLKEINPEYSLEGLLLKLQEFGHLMQRADSFWERPWCWERLRAGGEGGDRGWDGWQGITNSRDVNLSKLWEIVENRGAWRAAVCGVMKSQMWLGDWTHTLTHTIVIWERKSGGKRKAKNLKWKTLRHPRENRSCKKGRKEKEI